MNGLRWIRPTLPHTLPSHQCYELPCAAAPLPCAHREQQRRSGRDALPVGGAEDQRESHQPYYWGYVGGQQQLREREGSDKEKQCGNWCGSVVALSPGDICLSVCVHRRNSASGGQVCRFQGWGWCTGEIVYDRVYIRRCQCGDMVGGGVRMLRLRPSE